MRLGMSEPVLSALCSVARAWQTSPDTTGAPVSPLRRIRLTPKI